MWVGQEEEGLTGLDLGWASIGACLPPRDGGGQRGEMRFKYHNLDLFFFSCTFEEKEKRMVRGECTLLGGCKVFSFYTKYSFAAKSFFSSKYQKELHFLREHIHIKLIGGV